MTALLRFIKKNVLLLIIGALVLPHLLSSCTHTVSGGAKDTVVFEDALGRRIEVQKNVSRVAALLGSFADIWSLAGGTLCAAAEDAWEDFDLPLEDAKNLGGAHSPSLEILISSRPELVIASASTKSNIDMKDTLEAVGITVAYFDVDNFSDYLEMLKICTDITGREDLYRINGLDLKENIAQIKQNYASLEIPDSERRILLLRASASSVKAKGSVGTILGEMLADIGCVNIADSNSSLLENLSIESVIMNEPHHIFVVTMGENTDAAISSVRKIIDENPAWASLKAVKEERLHIMDKSLFNLKPNSRFAEAYGVLYETLIS